ncbi:hypothetical protein K469DRAFT_725001 [Zopfia rhizophila CBS 207.26]|uniref:FAD/NAD(P)-binding domain-containing protein n=1 Tax=Zopfia rhizophila CBS 207.26 TaxID=1314779 RepID=A0A6A6E7M3_9PEZI|nr:hypothetical protein K469DRAFT_725001 [Zopfia rhizophila CBS 207.26]
MKFTEAKKQMFREDHEYHLAFRRLLEGTINQRVNGFIMGTEAQKALLNGCRTDMLNRCRRMTPGDGYLEALTKPNVQMGIVSLDDTENKVDIIACATGFKLPFQPHFDVYGRDGISMKDDWSPDPNCYLGIAGPGFPNYWVIMGRRSSWGNISVLPAMETSCIKSLEPRQDVTDKLMEHINKFHKGSVWSQGRRSWYKRGQIDGRPWLWCGGVASYLAAIKKSPANYSEEYPDGLVPMPAFAPYIREPDTEWDFDY